MTRSMFNGSQRFERSKPLCNIGVLGHTGHGKSSLTAALIKSMAARKQADLISFDQITTAPEPIVHVSYETHLRQYNHMDYPNHIEVQKNVITAVAHMDAAILVVSAVEGVMPGTRDHLVLARHYQVPQILVFLNKVELVAPDQINKVEADVRGLLTAQGFPGDTVQVVRGSAQAVLSGKSPEIGEMAMVNLTVAMDYYIKPQERGVDKVFRMRIDDIYNLPGRPLAVSGFIEQGVTKVGEILRILGLKQGLETTRVIGMDLCNKGVDLAQAGDHIALLLLGVKKDIDVVEGQVLCKPDSSIACAGFTANVVLLSEQDGGQNDSIYNYDEPLFHFGACEVAGVASGLPGGRLQQGESGMMKVVLFDRVGILEGQRIAIRVEGRTIGFGVIAELNTRVSPNTRRVEVEPVDEGDDLS